MLHIIEQATDFGSFRSRNNLFSFALKVILYIIPATIIGHYTDLAVKHMKTRETLGENNLYYILFQTIFIIVTLYIFLLFLKNFTSEFQRSIAGSFFIALYFGMQTNYINMFKEFMTSLI